MGDLTIAIDPARAAAWAAGALAVVQALIRLGKTPMGEGWFDRLGAHRTRVVWGLALLSAVLSSYVGGASVLDALVVGLTVAGSAPAYDVVRARSKRRAVLGTRSARVQRGGEVPPASSSRGHADTDLLLSLGVVGIAFALLVATLLSAGCVATSQGRRLDPRVALGGDAACAVAQAACSAAGPGAPACAAVQLACAGWSSLRVAVGGGEGGGTVVWYCVAYDVDDLENPEAALACGEQRCVCWTDPQVAAEAAAELDGDGDDEAEGG